MLVNPNDRQKTQRKFDAIPVFPFDVFPNNIVEIINELKDGAGYIPDFTASAFLYAAAVAMGGTHTAQLMNGWNEPPIIFICLVAGAGVGKSHPLKFSLKPLFEADNLSFRQYKEAMSDWAANEDLPKKDRDSTIKKPIYKKFLLSDYTPEALAAKHADNVRGIGVYVDELAGWYGGFDRYKKGNEAEFWLSSFTGTPINIDRKGSESINIPNPTISVGGTIQPSVLQRTTADGKIENGFLDRILFCYPEAKKEAWRTTGITDEVREAWAKIIGKLMAFDFRVDKDGQSQAVNLPFTKEAETHLRKWQQLNTDRCNDDEVFAQIGTKGETYAIRLSLIIKGLRAASEAALEDMVNGGANRPNMDFIGLDDVKAAIALVDYFTATAMRIRGAALGDPLAMLTASKRKLYNALNDVFTTNEAVDAGKIHGLSERTAKRFLNEKAIFSKVDHGQYCKKII